jgi:hypothetical protein
MHGMQRMGMSMDMGIGIKTGEEPRQYAGHKKNGADILNPNPTSGNQGEKEA